MVTITEELVKQWQVLDKKLKEIKKQELLVRKEIAYQILGSAHVAGTQSRIFGQLEATASAATELKVEKEDLLAAQDALTEAEKQCIVWKPSVSKRLYDALPEDAALRKVVSSKVSCPTLKVQGDTAI